MKLGTDTRQPTTWAEGETLRAMRFSRDPVGEGARYLGYGVMSAFDSRTTGAMAGQLTRALFCTPRSNLASRCAVAVSMKRRPNRSRTRSSRWDCSAAWAPKSRKGYGSLALQSLLVEGQEAWRAPETMEELQEEITRLRRHCSPSPSCLPDYTALNQESRHVLAAASANLPLELLDMVGKEMVRYRSWGHQGRGLGRSF